MHVKRVSIGRATCSGNNAFFDTGGKRRVMVACARIHQVVARRLAGDCNRGMVAYRHERRCEG